MSDINNKKNSACVFIMRLSESKIMIYQSLKEGNLRNHRELIIRKIYQLKGSF